MKPARIALAAFALLLLPAMPAAVPANAQPDSWLQENVDRFLPDEPGAAVLLSVRPDGDAEIVSAGMVGAHALDLGTGPAFWTGAVLNATTTLDAAILINLVVERSAEAGLYNVYVDLQEGSAADVTGFDGPITLRNSNGVVIAEASHAAGSSALLSGRVDVPAGNHDEMFVRNLVDSEWLALRYESEEGARELLYRPNDRLLERAERLLDLWQQTLPQATETAPALGRPVQLSTVSESFNGTAYWRTILNEAGAPELRVSATISKLGLMFDMSLKFLENLVQIDVTVRMPSGVDRSYIPTDFITFVGDDYFVLPPPAETLMAHPDYEGGRLFRFSLPTDAFHRSLASADRFDIMFDHEGETLILRLYKDDVRGNALVEAAVASAVEWYEQLGPDEPLNDVPPFLLFPM